MKKMMALVAALSVACTLMAASAQFPYQAVLKDVNGKAMTGNKQVDIRLYRTDSDNDPLWGHTYSVLLDTNGLFNVEVSDAKGTAISGLGDKKLDTALTNETIYIGLRVGTTSGEIRPRQKLLSVPFAAVADNVSNASGNFTVTGTLQAKTATVTQALTANSVTVTGAASAGSVTTTGNATVSGNLTVSGTLSGFGIAPVGSIIMWSGSVANIPNGWVLCNGLNGTPNLLNRFIVGAGGNYSVGQIGGADAVTLTVQQMPSHNHAYKFTGADTSGSYKHDNFFYNQHGKYSDLTNTKYTEYSGGGQAHENRPPFYALCFIMRKQ